MSQYLSLEDAKRHLMVDFSEDDALIAEYIKASEGKLSNDLKRPLSELEGEGGELPSPLLHALRLLVGRFYMSREGVAFTRSVELPYSYLSLIYPYRNER